MKKRLSLDKRIAELRARLAHLDNKERAIDKKCPGAALPAADRRTRAGIRAALHVMEDARAKGITTYCKGEDVDYRSNQDVPADLLTGASQTLRRPVKA